MKQVKIIGIADIHVEKNHQREYEFKEVFSSFIEKIKDENADYIVIAGDSFDEVSVSHDTEIMFIDFLNNLLNHCKHQVIITAGNHDLFQSYITKKVGDKKLERIDIIKKIVSVINHPKIVYYSESGIYKHENVIFAVWAHNMKYNKKKAQFYNPFDNKLPDFYIENQSKKGTNDYLPVVNIYHDPIGGVKNVFGFTVHYNGKVTQDSFLGDFAILGDIHNAYGFTNSHGLVGHYTSSFISRGYGEGNYYRNGKLIVNGNENHGYLILDTSKQDNKLEWYSMYNKHSYHTVIIDEKFDYDNIDIPIQLTENNKLKVVIEDYKERYNLDKRNKIIDYFLNTYNIQLHISDFFENKLKSEKISFDTENDIFSELSDSNYLHSMMVEYMKKELKLSDDNISLIDEWDKKVLDMMKEKTYDKKNIQLQRLELDNFQSFGDNVIFDISDKTGIIKIKATNGVGKTTLVEGIGFPVYATTYQTISDNFKGAKANKGDLYINNERTRNNSIVSLYVSINDTEYCLVKEIKRIINTKTDEVSSVKTLPTKILVREETGYVDSDIDPKIFIEENFPDYDQYLKMIHTNSYNIADLSKIQPTDLITYILNILGLDVFFQKKEIFESIKNTLKIDAKKITKEEYLQLKEKYIKEIENLYNEIDILKYEQAELQDKIEIISKEKTDLEKELFNVDNTEFNIQSQINTLNKKIMDLISQKETCDNNIHYMETQVKIFETEVANFNLDAINDDLQKFYEFKSAIAEKTNELNMLGMNIKNIYSQIEIHESSKLMTIENIKNEYNKNIQSINSDIQRVKTKILEERNSILESYKKKLNDIKAKGIDTKNSITTKENNIKNFQFSIENLNNQNTIIRSKELVCENCNHKLHKLNQDDFNKIKSNDEKILDYESKIITTYNEIAELEKTVVQLREDYQKTEKEQNVFYNTVYNSEVESNELEELKKLLNITIQNNNQENYLHDERVIKIESQIQLLEKQIQLKELEKVQLNTVLQNLIEKNNDLLAISKLYEEYKKKKDDIENTKKSIFENKEKSLTLNNDISLSKNQLYELENNLKKIEKNKITRSKIDVIVKQLEKIQFDFNQLENSINDNKMEIVKRNTLMDQLENDYQLYLQSIMRSKLIDIYSDIHSKNGLAKKIFEKIIPALNLELNELLDGLNFQIFFDENSLDLKMKKLNQNNEYVYQYLSQGSGMEKTFSIISLKVILRKLNTKYNMDFIILDEISGLLNGDVSYVEETDNYTKDYQQLMITFLKERVMKYISKIIFIDHVLKEDELKPDHIYSLIKTTNGTIGYFN